MTLKKFILPITICFVYMNISSQKGYYDYDYSDKETILYDSFTSNKNEWSTYSDDEVDRSIYDGDYIINNKKSSGTATSLIPVSFDEDSDYEIEARINRVYGKKTTLLISLLWGSNSDDKNFFGFTGAGSYRVSKYVDSKYSAYKDWTKSDAIEKYSANLMTIRKVGSSMYFFINKKFVYSMYVKSFFGNKVGFQSPNGTKINISYLRVSKIKKSKKDYNFISFSEKKKFISEEFDDPYDKSWTKGSDGESFGEIYNGYYTFKSLNNVAWVSTKKHYIDQDRDFEITARFKYVSGKENSGLMLVWGRNSNKDNFNFEFNANGEYWIGTYNDGSFNASKSWTASLDINKKDYNLLTVRKIENNYYYFINREFVHSETFKPFFGDKIGFLTPGNTAIKIDYLRAYYLDNKSNNNNIGGEQVAPGGK